ncbi:hypothetical protein GCK32_020825 [Trichostrongylus colubriformis]|uniref:Uncharacterized protein n=1 Tax=Trichostrongylus colubriformis TaxID=6319 RepID=A0AAN8ISY0_TRICO
MLRRVRRTRKIIEGKVRNCGSSANVSVDDRPNVYILLLDAVSSLQAKRSLPRTLAYLKTELDAVQMEFMNKVGKNSRPNGFSLFFG